MRSGHLMTRNGYRLSSLPCRSIPAMQERRVCAQVWLRALEFAGGDWGHVEQTGANADSTAFALIFSAHAAVRAVPAGNFTPISRRMAGFRPLSTTASYGVWIQSHPDVTAVAPRQFEAS